MAHNDLHDAANSFNSMLVVKTNKDYKKNNSVIIVANWNNNFLTQYKLVGKYMRSVI